MSELAPDAERPMTRRERPLVSIVCPVLNEEEAIEPFHRRLTAVLEPLRGDYDFELLFTNNRSTDRTAERILALREHDRSVQLLTFSKNYGYQFSLLAGLRQAAGDLIIAIDVDCEDPPELIPRFLEGWRHGFDIVYGERDRREEPAVVTWMRKIFYRVNRLTADSDIVLDMAEFCVMTAAVRDAVTSSGSTYPFIRAEIAHYGFRRLGIRYNRERRIVGRTHYNFWRMTEFAVAGILSSTTAPLRLTLYLLPLLVLVNAALLALQISGAWAWGFETLVCVDFLYVSVALAFIALYTARNYRNVIARPFVVVDWRMSAINSPPERSPIAIPRQGPTPG